MSPTVNMRGRHGRIIALLLVVVLGTTAAAWAYWSQPSKGSASGHVGTLNAPTISGATGGGESATLSWTAVSAPASEAVRYYVSRDGAPAGGSCPTSSSPSTATSCTDAGVSPGSHSYTVTAVWRSWTATSAAKAATAISNPTVAAASPASRGQGAGAQSVTITGSHFSSGASASFSGSGVAVNSTTFKSSTELTVAITVAANATTGSRNVTVTNPDAGTGTGSGIFTVTAAPTVTSTSPNSRGQGAISQTVAIKGSGFSSGATSSFGAGVTVNSTTFKSSTELTANVTIEAGASTGARTVTVTNADGGTGSLAGAFSITAAPTVTSTNPNSRGQGAVGQNVAIKGSGFTSGASSSFGAGITVNSTTFKSSTELTANVTIEAGASIGARTVTVVNADGGTASLAGAFTVNAPPNVESTSPSSRPQGASKQTVAIKGSGFSSGATSSFGSGITVESTTFVNSTELSAKVSVEAGASTGARTVTVTNLDGGVDTLASGFTVNSLPNVESASPNSGNRSGTETVVIKGSGFAGGASSSFGSGVIVESTTFVSSTELRAKVSIESFASTGSRTVTVTNPDGGTDSQASAFTVNSSPTVTNVSPGSRGQGASSQAIAITGSHFESGAAASFSGSGITVNSTTFVSTTEVTANITVASNAATGSRNVTVTNPDTTGATDFSAFSITAAPTVTSTNPNSRGQGAVGQNVAIKGSGFTSGASSSFGAGITVNSTTFKSSTELTANVTIEAGASIGARTVTVVNADGGTASLAGAFTVNAPPNVESTSPSSRPQGASKQTVAIKGSGFSSGATSSFGSGITVESTTFVNSTELSAKVSVEAGASTGARTVTVTNLDGGVDTLASGFTVTSGPSVESISPNAGHRGASQAVTIKGSGFSAGASAAFGSGITVSSTTFKSATELTANITIEAGASTGARSVTVTNPDFGSGSLASAFTVNNAPSIESLSPSSRAQGATGQTIVVKGANFESGAGLAVSLSGTGITVNSTSFVSTTQVSANISIAPNAPTGARTLTLTNPDATTATATFTVNAPPSVTSTSPGSRGQGASNQTVAIKGSGFASGATSSFGSGITVNSTTFKSSTELTANITIEAGASTGARTVTVTNLDTGVGSLASAFTVNGAPNAESVSPSSRGQGATNQTVTVKGSGFVSGTGLAVSFSGSGITVNSTTFKSSTELTANISVESGASTGARTVTVTNPDGGTDTIAGGFTVNAAPSISSPTSSFGSRVRITHSTSGEFKVLGSGFVSGMTVSISGGFTVNSMTFVNSGELKVKVTAGNNGQRGAYDLTVTNPDGGWDISEGSIENT